MSLGAATKPRIVVAMPRRQAKFPARYRISQGDKFKLARIDPGETGQFKAKEDAEELLEQGVARLCELQEKLYAQAEWSLLLVFQAVDAAGKDATIKHVLSGLNPQSCAVASFKKPSAKELKHDFLWRAALALPERGQIGVFNRSYYEEVLLVRVHSDYLQNQHLPRKLVTKRIWQERYQSINDFERHLTRNGTVVLKFFLHLSAEEQRRRILERLEDKEKNWKFEPADIAERKHWKSYLQVHEKMIQATATKAAPWHVIPADNKWFTCLMVAAAIIEKLGELRLHLPTPSAEEKAEMAQARRKLKNEKRPGG